MIQNKQTEHDLAFESEQEHKRTEYEYDCSGTDGNWTATDAPSGGDEEARHWQGRAY